MEKCILLWSLTISKELLTPNNALHCFAKKSPKGSFFALTPNTIPGKIGPMFVAPVYSLRNDDNSWPPGQGLSRA